MTSFKIEWTADAFASHGIRIPGDPIRPDWRETKRGGPLTMMEKRRRQQDAYAEARKVHKCRMLQMQKEFQEDMDRGWVEFRQRIAERNEMFWRAHAPYATKYEPPQPPRGVFQRLVAWILD